MTPSWGLDLELDPEPELELRLADLFVARAVCSLDLQPVWPMERLP
jgi:hypothetical protein